VNDKPQTKISMPGKGWKYPEIIYPGMMFSRQLKHQREIGNIPVMVEISGNHHHRYFMSIYGDILAWA
jgi:hypothetical protein